MFGETTINGKVRVLPKQDRKPSVLLDANDGKNYLVVTRQGETQLIKITNRVAEELVAMGLSYGN